MAESTKCPECGKLLEQMSSGLFACPNGHGKLRCFTPGDRMEWLEARRTERNEKKYAAYPIATRTGGHARVRRYWRLRKLVAFTVEDRKGEWVISDPDETDEATRVRVLNAQGWSLYWMSPVEETPDHRIKPDESEGKG